MDRRALAHQGRACPVGGRPGRRPSGRGALPARAATGRASKARCPWSCAAPPASPDCGMHQGRTEPARDLLVPLYGRFTEGFDTTDLRPRRRCSTASARWSSMDGAVKSSARLRLTLLGGFQAQLDAGAALVLPTKKTQALLAYLALPLGQAHPREKLATPAVGRHAGCPGPGQPAPRPLENPQGPAQDRPAGHAPRWPKRGAGPLGRGCGRGAVRAAGRRRPPRRARAESPASIGATCWPGWRWPSARSRSGSRPSGSACTSWPSRPWAACSPISRRPAPPSPPSRPVSASSRWTRCRSPSTARSCGSMRGSGAGRPRCASTSFAWTR